MANQLQETMLRHVEKWRKGQLSKKAYANKIGITRHKFEYWIRKAKETSCTEAVLPDFIEIKTKPIVSFEEKQENPPAISPLPRIVLTLPGGISLQIY
jgi:hypothetical protein